MEVASRPDPLLESASLSSSSLACSEQVLVPAYISHGASGFHMQCIHAQTLDTAAAPISPGDSGRNIAWASPACTQDTSWKTQPGQQVLLAVADSGPHAGTHDLVKDLQMFMLLESIQKLWMLLEQQMLTPISQCCCRTLSGSCSYQVRGPDWCTMDRAIPHGTGSLRHLLLVRGPLPLLTSQLLCT
jgi:hypothetical protein